MQLYTGDGAVVCKFQSGGQVRVSNCGLFTEPYKENEFCYTLPSLHLMYSRYMYCLCHNNVVSSCVVIGCPTLLTIALQGQAEYSTVTHSSWRRVGLVHETAAAGAPLTPL